MAYRTHLQARRNRYAQAAAAHRPMSDLNITPLIDVMLVLLIMMIMAIPIATHQLTVPLPQGAAGPPQTDEYVLRLDARGQAYWNGEKVTMAELRPRLEGLSAHDSSLLKFQSDPRTRYDVFVQHMKLVEDSGVDKVAFAGLGKPAGW